MPLPARGSPFHSLGCMNELIDLIEHLEAEPYYFVGPVWSAARGTNSLPFDVDCEFTREETAVVVDGKYRLLPGGVQHPFQLRLPFVDAASNVSSVVLTTPALGTVSGKMFFFGGSANFLGRAEAAALSAQLTVSERGVFGLSGVLEIQGRPFGYYLKGVASSDRATLSNVVGISNQGS